MSSYVLIRPHSDSEIQYNIVPGSGPWTLMEMITDSVPIAAASFDENGVMTSFFAFGGDMEQVPKAADLYSASAWVGNTAQ